MFAFLYGCAPRNTANERPAIGDSVCAKFEYVYEENGGYKVITSEIKILSNYFDSIILIPLEEPFSGDWIYRITFDWEEIVPGGNEIPVLVGEDSMSINGTTYTTEEGVDFSGILETISSKYNYFDYVLQYD
jgi:hypothetical protein